MVKLASYEGRGMPLGKGHRPRVLQALWVPLGGWYSRIIRDSAPWIVSREQSFGMMKGVTENCRIPSIWTWT